VSFSPFGRVDDPQKLADALVKRMSAWKRFGDTLLVLASIPFFDNVCIGRLLTPIPFGPFELGS